VGKKPQKKQNNNIKVQEEDIFINKNINKSFILSFSTKLIFPTKSNMFLEATMLIFSTDESIFIAVS
jgi:hypothetical protein